MNFSIYSILRKKLLPLLFGIVFIFGALSSVKGLAFEQVIGKNFETQTGENGSYKGTIVKSGTDLVGLTACDNKLLNSNLINSSLSTTFNCNGVFLNQYGQGSSLPVGVSTGQFVGVNDPGALSGRYSYNGTEYGVYGLVAPVTPGALGVNYDIYIQSDKGNYIIIKPGDSAADSLKKIAQSCTPTSASYDATKCSFATSGLSDVNAVFENNEGILDTYSATDLLKNTNNLTVADRNVLANAIKKATELQGGATNDLANTRCSAILSDKKDPLYYCVKNGSRVKPDGSALPTGCNTQGYFKVKLTATEFDSCVSPQDAKATDDSGVNSKINSINDNSKKDIGDQDWVKILYRIVLGIILLIAYVFSWVAAIVLWTIMLILVFFLLFNPFVTFAAGTGIAISLWQLFYGIGILIVVVGIVYVGFLYLLGGKNKPNLKDLLTNVVVVLLGINFTFFLVVSLFSVTNGISRVLIYSYGYVDSQGFQDATKSIPAARGTDFKYSYYLVQGITGNIARISILRCGTADVKYCQDNKEDFTKGTSEIYKIAIGENTTNGPIQQIFKDSVGVAIATIFAEIAFLFVCLFFIDRLIRMSGQIFGNLLTIVVFAATSPIILAAAFSNNSQLKSYGEEQGREALGAILFFPITIFLLIMLGIFAKNIGEISSSVIKPVTTISGIDVLAQTSGSFDEVLFGFFVPTVVGAFITIVALDRIIKFISKDNMGSAGRGLYDLGKSAITTIRGNGVKDVSGTGFGYNDKGEVVKVKQGIGSQIAGLAKNGAVRTLGGVAVGGLIGGVPGAVLGATIGSGALAGTAGRLRTRFSTEKATTDADGKAVVVGASNSLAGARATSNVIVGGRIGGAASTANQRDNRDIDADRNFDRRIDRFIQIFGSRLPELAKKALRGIDKADFKNFANLSSGKQSELVNNLSVLGSTGLGAKFATSIFGADNIKKVLEDKGNKLSAQSRGNLDRAVGRAESKRDSSKLPMRVSKSQSGGANTTYGAPSFNTEGGVNVTSGGVAENLTVPGNRIKINVPRGVNTPNTTMPQTSTNSRTPQRSADLPQDTRVLPQNARGDNNIPLPPGTAGSRVVPNFDRTQTNYDQAITETTGTASLDQSLSNRSAIGALTRAGVPGTTTDVGAPDTTGYLEAVRAQSGSTKPNGQPTTFTGQINVENGDRPEFNPVLPGTREQVTNVEKVITTKPETASYVGAQTVFNQPKAITPDEKFVGNKVNNTGIQEALNLTQPRVREVTNNNPAPQSIQRANQPQNSQPSANIAQSIPEQVPVPDRIPANLGKAFVTPPNAQNNVVRLDPTVFNRGSSVGVGKQRSADSSDSTKFVQPPVKK